MSTIAMIAAKIRGHMPVTLDSWNDLFNAAGVILIGLTFIFGLGALLTGRQINQRQSTELLRLGSELAAAQTAVAEQQERAAKAETELVLLQSKVRPRTLSAKFIEAVRGKPPGVVKAIWHLPSDGEAHQLAMQLFVNLAAEGWPPVWPSAVPSGAIRWNLSGMSQAAREGVPALMLIGGQPTGVTLVAPSIADPACALLMSAFNADGFGVAVYPDERLLPNEVEIIVGQKP